MVFNFSETTRPQLYRFSFIDKMIKAGGYPNSRDLAERLEVSRRTILRDVEFLKDSLQAPLKYCPRQRGYYYTEAGYSLGLLKFTEGEILALFLGHNLLTKCKGTPYEHTIVSAFKKICLSLQETVNIDFGQLSDYISFDLDPFRGEEKRIANLFSIIGGAIKENRTIKIVHYSIARDICQERLVDPYQIRFYREAWYLIGFCKLRNEIRIFALDRIRTLTVTEDIFVMNKGYNSKDYIGDAFQMFKGPETYQVKIWFSPEQARWIKEKVWHPTQEIVDNKDGSVIFYMRTSGLFQVKRWILSFGPDAKVLAPEKLLSAVSDELNAASSLYLNQNK